VPPAEPRTDLDALLYDGESVVEAVDCETGRVAVTSHRLLVLTPDGDGPNVRAVERPNVEAVTTARTGGESAAETGLKAGVVGVVAVAAAPAAAVDVPSVALGSGAIAGLGALTSLFGLLSRLDDALRLLGVGALLVALVAGVWVVRARRNVVRVDIAGGDDLHLEASDPDAVAAALESALRRGDASASSTPAP
jgi:hypothetical protein